MKAGIVSWGAYVPPHRIRVEDIAQAHGADANDIKAGLLLAEKAVAALDEDAATMAVEAGRIALERLQQRQQQTTSRIGALLLGSESHPYAVKPSTSILAEALGLPPTLFSADLQFACKAGTTALQLLLSLVKAGDIEYGLGGGSDTAQSKPGELLEYATGAGAALFVLGSGENVIAEIKKHCSYMTDTPDFWRRPLKAYPRHAGGFTAEPAYFHHTVACTQALLSKMGTTPQDYDFAIFHQPNGKFPRKVAQQLGFTAQQVEPSIIVDKIGNTYSASSLLALIQVLEQAKPGQTILLTSFGSGAGADSFHIETKEGIEEVARAALPGQSLASQISRKRFISYATHARRHLL